MTSCKGHYFHIGTNTGKLGVDMSVDAQGSCGAADGLAVVRCWDLCQGRCESHANKQNRKRYRSSLHARTNNCDLDMSMGGQFDASSK